MAVNKNFITIIDADENEIDCEILDILEYEGKEYVILLPVDDQSEEPEAVILERVNATAQDDDVTEPAGETLRGVDDEATLDAVFAAFQRNGGHDYDN